MEEQTRLLNYKDLMTEYRFSRVRAYHILNDKYLPVIRLGMRLFVKRDSFEKWLDSKSAGGAGE